ncbi:hypothetical protein Bbelb_159830 [Branchiostoma belcheri]|nr:hypothetical protein Bbelb_159830 [Branchiostoma belcheri]
MIIQLHENQFGQVRYENDLSGKFPIQNGVKQGCVLAPTPFTIFLSIMLEETTKDLDDEDGIYIRYRTDGSLFNLRRLQAHTKTLEKLIRELLFADDAAHSEKALQRITTCFDEAARLFGLEVSLKKTEVLYQPPPKEAYRPPQITIGQSQQKPVHIFTYLGSTITSDGKLDKEIDTRLSKANKAWVTYRRHLRLLERFHQRCLRSILKIHWSDFLTNVEVLEKAGTCSTEAMLLKTQLRWAGHVSRMEEHRLPKIVLYGELASGHRDVGAPKKRYKDYLKSTLNACQINHRQWSTLLSTLFAHHLTNVQQQGEQKRIPLN